MSLLDGCQYAVKRSAQRFRSEGERARSLKEARNHEGLYPHPHVVGFIAAWEEGGRLYIQTELCCNSLLVQAEEMPSHTGMLHGMRKIIILLITATITQAYFRTLKLFWYGIFIKKKCLISVCVCFVSGEVWAWTYLCDILSALKHLHTQGFAHLDIKPANVFITKSGRLKLGDFGLLIKLSNDGQKQERDQDDLQEGDPRYMAPELLRGKYGTAADIFRLVDVVLDLIIFYLSTLTSV